MAQIFKISGYLIDINDSHTKDDVRLSITDKIDMFSQQLHIESTNIEDWDDDNPLNFENCDLSYCTQYFKIQIMVNVLIDHYPKQDKNIDISRLEK